MTREVWRETIKGITTHILKSIDGADSDNINKFVKELTDAKRIFIYGAGRSGLAARAFAMRLMHLERHVFVIGETITPSMQPEDLFVCITGSGETSSVIDYMKSAKKRGSKIVCVTSHPKSTAAGMSELVVLIKGKTKIDVGDDYHKRQVKGEHASFTPMGTLFEDTVTVFFDGIIAELMFKLNKNEEQMFKKHASVE